jgi:hypothetical protein
VEVTNNINPGIATIIIKGIGNYNSQVKKEFTISEPPTTEAPVTAQTVVTTKSNKIVVKKATVKRVAKKKNAKKINLVLKKVAGATKYQVKISTTKKFKKILVSKNVKKIKVTIKHKSLANKKKLYIKVRALKVVNGKLYKGAWSDAKKIVIKK